MSKKQESSTTGRQQFWKALIEKWRSSGLSVRKFCKQEGLTEPAFYSWRRKLACNNAQQDKKNASRSSAFIKVAMAQNNPSALELVLASGNSLRISSATDIRTLSDVLSSLKQAGLC